MATENMCGKMVEIMKDIINSIRSMVKVLIPTLMAPSIEASGSMVSSMAKDV